MDLEFLNRIVWQNSIKSYLLFIGIIVLGLIFKGLFSKLISRFIYTFFKKFSKEIKVDKFLELLIGPIEFLILILFLFN